MIISLKAVAGLAIVLALAAAVGAFDSKSETPFNITLTAPAKCKDHECKLSLTINYVNEGFKFSLHAEDKAYVAVAFAGAAMMGDDKAIECVATNTSEFILVYHSTNSGPPFSTARNNIRDKRQEINSVATDITGGSKDGHVFCSFVLKPTITFPDSTSLNLMKSRFYLQIASGGTVAQSNIGKHNKWATTLRAVSLTKDEGKLKTVDSLMSYQSSGSKLTTPGWMLTIILIAKAW